MKVGFFSPMPPARSGIADHAVQLLSALQTSALRGEASVELSASRADVNLYHLGNNQLHADIYRRALREPGVVILHDAVLHHFLLGFLNRDEYIAEFTLNYGLWNSGTASELWQNRARSAADHRYFDFPMARRIAERSRAIIVHNPAAERIVRNHCPGARVVRIPLLFEDRVSPDAAEILAARKRMNAQPADTVCGVFGHLRESKRIGNVVKACEQTGLKLIIAGECSSDLQRSLTPDFARPFVRRIGYTSESDFRLLMHASDICVNLRYPSAGETSAITIAAMGAAKPVLVTNSEENSAYPASAAVRIASGMAELANLISALEWLRRYPAHAREIGQRGATEVRREHDASRVAALYWQVLRSA